MKKILIHAGTGKTGTSSIQAFLNRQSFDGIIYPGFPLGNHNLLTALYRPQEKWPTCHHRYFNDFSRRKAYRIRRQMSRSFVKAMSSGKNVILSGEILETSPEDEICLLRDDLRRYDFNDIRIVFYVREPSAYYLSRMGQRVRDYFSIIKPSMFLADYQMLIERWERFFPGQVIVRAFSKEIFRNSDIITDFIDVLNDYFGMNIQDPPEFEKLNESPGVEQLLILEGFRRELNITDQRISDRRYEYLKYHIAETSRLHNLKLTKPELKRDVANIIQRNHQEEISYLQNRWGITFPERAIPADTKHNSENDYPNYLSIVENCDMGVALKLNTLLSELLIRRILHDAHYLDWIRNPYRRLMKYFRNVGEE